MFGTMLVLALALDCDSGSTATALFYALLLAATVAAGGAFYAESDVKRRLLSSVFGALLAGIARFFLTGFVGFLRCGGD